MTIIDSSVVLLPQNDMDVIASECEAIQLIDAPHPNPPRSRGGKRVAFTLAEVLITLGIIGVVAAMTIPSLITKHQKSRVETQLKAFYANINNALRLSEEENGDWSSLISSEITENNYDNNLAFAQKYIAPYIKVIDIKKRSKATAPCLVFIKGDSMSLNIYTSGAIDIGYFPTSGDCSGIPKRASRSYFAFRYTNGSTSARDRSNNQSLILPYEWGWDGTREGLMNSSNTNYGCFKGCADRCIYCAKLIQLNSWKIPDDYPW